MEIKLTVLVLALFFKIGVNARTQSVLPKCAKCNSRDNVDCLENLKHVAVETCPIMTDTCVWQVRNGVLYQGCKSSMDSLRPMPTVSGDCDGSQCFEESLISNILCYSCNSREFDQCMENPQISKAFVEVCPDKQDSCVWRIENNIVFRGCKSSFKGFKLENGISGECNSSRCNSDVFDIEKDTVPISIVPEGKKKCESKKCRKEPSSSRISCFTCSSAKNLNCMTKPNENSLKLCENPKDKCMWMIYRGVLYRGCKDTFSNFPVVAGHSGECASSGCNSEPFNIHKYHYETFLVPVDLEEDTLPNTSTQKGSSEDYRRVTQETGDTHLEKDIFQEPSALEGHPDPDAGLDKDTSTQFSDVEGSGGEINNTEQLIESSLKQEDTPVNTDGAPNNINSTSEKDTLQNSADPQDTGQNNRIVAGTMSSDTGKDVLSISSIHESTGEGSISAKDSPEDSVVAKDINPTIYEPETISDDSSNENKTDDIDLEKDSNQTTSMSENTNENSEKDTSSTSYLLKSTDEDFDSTKDKADEAELEQSSHSSSKNYERTSLEEKRIIQGSTVADLGEDTLSDTSLADSTAREDNSSTGTTEDYHKETDTFPNIPASESNNGETESTEKKVDLDTLSNLSMLASISDDHRKFAVNAKELDPTKENLQKLPILEGTDQAKDTFPSSLNLESTNEQLNSMTHKVEDSNIEPVSPPNSSILTSTNEDMAIVQENLEESHPEFSDLVKDTPSKLVELESMNMEPSYLGDKSESGPPSPTVSENTGEKGGSKDTNYEQKDTLLYTSEESVPGKDVPEDSSDDDSSTETIAPPTSFNRNSEGMNEETDNSNFAKDTLPNSSVSESSSGEPKVVPGHVENLKSEEDTHPKATMLESFSEEPPHLEDSESFVQINGNGEPILKIENDEGSFFAQNKGDAKNENSSHKDSDSKEDNLHKSSTLENTTDEPDNPIKIEDTDFGKEFNIETVSGNFNNLEDEHEGSGLEKSNFPFSSIPERTAGEPTDDSQLGKDTSLETTSVESISGEPETATNHTDDSNSEDALVKFEVSENSSAELHSIVDKTAASDLEKDTLSNLSDLESLSNEHSHLVLGSTDGEPQRDLDDTPSSLFGKDTLIESIAPQSTIEESDVSNVYQVETSGDGNTGWTDGTEGSDTVDHNLLSSSLLDAAAEDKDAIGDVLPETSRSWKENSADSLVLGETTREPEGILDETPDNDLARPNSSISSSSETDNGYLNKITNQIEDYVPENSTSYLELSTERFFSTIENTSLPGLETVAYQTYSVMEDINDVSIPKNKSSSSENFSVQEDINGEIRNEAHVPENFDSFLLGNIAIGHNTANSAFEKDTLPNHSVLLQSSVDISRHNNNNNSDSDKDILLASAIVDTLLDSATMKSEIDEPTSVTHNKEISEFDNTVLSISPSTIEPFTVIDAITESDIENETLPTPINVGDIRKEHISDIGKDTLAMVLENIIREHNNTSYPAEESDLRENIPENDAEGPFSANDNSKDSKIESDAQSSPALKDPNSVIHNAAKLELDKDTLQYPSLLESIFSEYNRTRYNFTDSTLEKDTLPDSSLLESTSEDFNSTKDNIEGSIIEEDALQNSSIKEGAIETTTGEPIRGTESTSSDPEQETIPNPDKAEAYSADQLSSGTDILPIVKGDVDDEHNKESYQTEHSNSGEETLPTDSSNLEGIMEDNNISADDAVNHGLEKDGILNPSFLENISDGVSDSKPDTHVTFWIAEDTSEKPSNVIDGNEASDRENHVLPDSSILEDTEDSELDDDPLPTPYTYREELKVEKDILPNLSSSTILEGTVEEPTSNEQNSTVENSELERDTTPKSLILESTAEKSDSTGEITGNESDDSLPTPYTYLEELDAERENHPNLPNSAEDTSPKSPLPGSPTNLSNINAEDSELETDTPPNSPEEPDSTEDNTENADEESVPKPFSLKDSREEEDDTEDSTALLEAGHECYTCSSEDDEMCLTKPKESSVKACKDPKDSCAWQIVDGVVQRGCKATFSNFAVLEGTSGECNTSLCNNAHISEIRLGCHHCQGAECLMSPGKVQLCKTYQADDKCFIDVIDDKTVARGCMSDKVNCVGKFCNKCDKFGCNNQPGKGKFQCASCRSEDSNDCIRQDTALSSNMTQSPNDICVVNNEVFCHHDSLFGHPQKCFTYHELDVVIRGCSKDMPKKIRGSKNIVECFGDNCNKDCIKNIRCAICDSRTDPKCKNDIDHLELHECPPHLASCHTCDDNNGTVTRGCGASSDYSDLKCGFCQEKDGCNAERRPVSCYTCDSRYDPNCAQWTNESNVEVCPHPDDSCIWKIAAEYTMRGCSSTVRDCIDGDVDCGSCREDKCNGGVKPDNRLQCHQCEGSECVQKIGAPVPCEYYRPGDKCFTGIIDENNVVRGCMSDKVDRCLTLEKCFICSAVGCNRSPFTAPFFRKPH